MSVVPLLSLHQQFPELPDEAWIQVSLFLTAPENLALLSSCRRQSFHLGRSTRFWKALVSDDDTTISTAAGAAGETRDVSTTPAAASSDLDWKFWKRRYLIGAHCQHLPWVQWKIVRQHHYGNNEFRENHHHDRHLTFRHDPPTDREGHLACALDNRSLLLVTGGFTDDNRVYLKELQERTTTTAAAADVRPWYAVTPTTVADAVPTAASDGLHNVYGASLTALPNSLLMTARNDDSILGGGGLANSSAVNPGSSTAAFPPVGEESSNSTIISAAVRFGGFRSGGYTWESAQVAVLTVTRHCPTAAAAPASPSPRRVATHKDDSHRIEQSWWYTAEWRVIPTKRQSDAACTSTTTRREDDFRLWEHTYVARAYHSATLLHGRYLLILGGMCGSRGGRHHDTEERQTMKPLILDCKTWTWLDNLDVVSAATSSVLEPGQPLRYPVLRYGHSTIYDEIRNRILVFGGGTGTDLLRSGSDRHEVWQLKPPQMATGMGHVTDSVDNDDFLESFPWEWTKLHDLESENSMGDERSRRGNQSGAELQLSVVKGASGGTRGNVNLCLAERLPLGRCHMSHKVSSNTVLFMFGSGTPCSTNGLLAYNLVHDYFFHPGGIHGPLPIPRFTAVSAFFPQSGQIFVHGGFCTQEFQTTSQAAVLQLVPPRVLDMWPTLSTAQQVPPKEQQNHHNRRILSLDASFLFQTRGQSYLPVTQRNLERPSVRHKVLFPVIGAAVLSFLILLGTDVFKRH